MKRNLFLLTPLLLYVSLAVGQNQWQWLNPRPSGYSCLKVVFTDHVTGFILNSNGDLIRTSDQGNSWTIAGNFPRATCMDVKDSTGVIASITGRVYVSSDNGTSWQAVRTDTVDAFQFVNIVSRDSFFISTPNGIIYSTGDRGKSWVANTCNARLSCLSFINSKIGFAGSPSSTILKTVDGAKTWKTLNQVNYSNGNIRAIDFRNQDTGYAYRESDTMLITHDGGNTWNGYDAHLASTATTIDFVSPLTGFLGGEGGVLYRSTDGGITWTYTGPSNNFKYGHDINSLAFVTVDTGFAVGFLGQIWKTTDSGSTWSAYSPTYTNVADAYFASPTVGYAANGSNVLKTTDSGRTWNPLGLTTGNNFGDYSTFKYLHFSSPDTGYVISDQYVQAHRTNDGGQTWTTIIPTAGSYMSAPGISYPAPQTALLCLNQAIVQTTDGGNTWPTVWTVGATQASGPPYYLNNIFSVNPTTAFGAYSGQVFKTTNGFQSWTQVFGSSGGYDITGLWFFNAQKGFIVDDEGDIFETTNGGNTWVQVRQYGADDEGNFNGIVKFFNSQVGYMTNGSIFGSGSYGRVYKTVDGGQTWQLSHTTGGVSIEFTPDSNVVIAGYGGSILREAIGGWQVDSLHVAFNNSCGTVLSCSIGAALGKIDSIQFEVTSAGGNKKLIDANPGFADNGRVSVVSTLNGLLADTLYSVRMRFLFNGSVAYSDTVEFEGLGLPQPYIADSAGTLISSAATGNQWYLSGSVISGATGRRLVPGGTGSYTVQASQNGCTSPMSTAVEFSVDALGVVVYPNPVKDLLYLLNTQNRVLSVRIVDLTGRTLMTLDYKGSPIKVSELAPGEYILNVVDKGNGKTGNVLFLKL